jgi:hypothetical protein
MQCLICLALVAATSLMAAGLAEAAPTDTRAPSDAPALYRQECGSCHAAYPPRLLPPASWGAVLNDLPHHFGTDASVEPEIQRRLAGWLHGQGAVGRPRPDGDRITRSGWFRHEHSELPTAVWSRPSIKSPSNCGACHVGADSGVFDEHDVRIPR